MLLLTDADVPIKDGGPSCYHCHVGKTIRKTFTVSFGKIKGTKPRCRRQTCLLLGLLWLLRGIKNSREFIVDAAGSNQSIKGQPAD